MKQISHKFSADYVSSLMPMAEISGFPVRPGMFDIAGATELPTGVNFTIHTRYGPSCELLLFKPGQREPYAVLPFPE